MKISKKSITLFILFGIFILLGLFLFLLPLFSNNKIEIVNIIGAILCALIAIVFLVVGILDRNANVAETKKKKTLVRQISLIGIMGAISCVLYMFISFPLPFFPGFLKIHFSEIPAVITGFAYGPLAGVGVLFVRAIVNLPMTTTSGVGELADLLIGCALVLPSSIIYRKHHTLKGALVGFLCSIFLSIIVAVIANWLILIPFYLELFFEGNWDPLINMCKMIPGINQDNFMSLYLLVGVVPFNLFRYIIVFILTFFLYKRIHRLLQKFVS